MKKYVYRDSEGNAMECYSAATVDERIAHLKAASARDHAKEHALTARVAELEGALDWLLNFAAGDPAMDGDPRIAKWRALLAKGGR